MLTPSTLLSCRVSPASHEPSVERESIVVFVVSLSSDRVDDVPGDCILANTDVSCSDDLLGDDCTRD